MTCRLECRVLSPTWWYSLCIPHHNQYCAVFKSCSQFFFSSLHPSRSASSWPFQLAKNVFHLFPCTVTRIFSGFFKKTLWFLPMVFDRNPTHFIPEVATWRPATLFRITCVKDCFCSFFFVFTFIVCILLSALLIYLIVLYLQAIGITATLLKINFNPPLHAVLNKLTDSLWRKDNNSKPFFRN